MKPRGTNLPAADLGSLAGLRSLGDRAAWGRVAYVGRAFAPAPGTYRSADASSLRHYFSAQDSGTCPTTGRALTNLYPLVAAALYEVAFAAEAGPLLTWSN